MTLGSEESNEHLVAFAYSGNYLYIDSSHFRMDGGGKFHFLKMLLYEYLSRKYPEAEFPETLFVQTGECSLIPEEQTEQIDSPLRKNINKYVKNKKELF